MTHLGQRPPGASGGMGDWHFGQIFRCVVVIHPSPERSRFAGYKVSANELENRQNGLEARCNLSSGMPQEGGNDNKSYSIGIVETGKRLQPTGYRGDDILGAGA